MIPTCLRFSYSFKRAFIKHRLNHLSQNQNVKVHVENMPENTFQHLKSTSRTSQQEFLFSQGVFLYIHLM